ncbi:hypothetical protein KJ562_03095 [Patescibacteria group bacterium]|nr:hypothetical protein [Patescibacteria group bacterium]MBU4162136.1 hypothetical protein [Patescibacteria group bacterium]
MVLIIRISYHGFSKRKTADYSVSKDSEIVGSQMRRSWPLSREYAIAAARLKALVGILYDMFLLPLSALLATETGLSFLPHGFQKVTVTG